MLVGVISDTHDRLDSLEKAVEIFKQKQVEMIIHCGDWVSPFTLEFFDRICEGFVVPVHSVIGNNPGDLKRIVDSNPKMNNPIHFGKYVTNEVLIADRNAVITHGHDKLVLNTLIDSAKYDVVFTGHTHAVRNEVIGKTLVLNPGTTCYACEVKIIPTATIGIYSSDLNTAEIVTLG